MKKVLIWMFVPALLLILSSCTSRQSTEKRSDLTVKVIPAKASLAEQKEEFPFIAKPFRTTELSFRVSGPIQKFDVISGNYYRKGEVIAEIDPRDFRIRKEKAEAVYLQAKAEFERIESLYDKNNLSASAFEKARADHTTAKTVYETALNELNDTRLIAPFDGFAGELYMEKYQDVKASQPVLSFVELDRLRIEIYVPQQVVTQARDRVSVEVLFDAFPKETFSSVLLDVSKSPSRNNLSYLLTSALNNKDHRLLAGMSGKVVFRQESFSEKPLTVIPQSALCHRPSVGDYVWVIGENSCAERRIVKTGDMLADGTVEIREGIVTGECIAVSGLRFLSENKKVNVADKPESVTVNRIVP